LGSSLTVADAARELGRILTGTEAKDLADRLADGDTVTAALKAVAPGRRTRLRSLLDVGDPTVTAREKFVPVLRAVQGARSATTSTEPLWTMPGHLVKGGQLTSSVSHLVSNARRSVTCSTFNFQRTSSLWSALRAAALRTEITVRVYVDTEAADQTPKTWTPTTIEVAEHLHPGIVMRTKAFDGATVRNHAKFLAIDHRFLLVTSANFSWSAEHGNVELGVLADNPNLVQAIESEMRRVEDSLYERVVRCGGAGDA
jgi:phosphatidylserine/phosphatidylglycerophosphate/cardiolipin synthase-like enzyme